MMEIAFGPVILACATKSLAFGVLLALLIPALEARLGAPVPRTGPARRLGLCLLSGGLFGLIHLAVVCAADGFPPRIIQSAAAMLLMTAAIGALIILREIPVQRPRGRVQA